MSTFPLYSCVMSIQVFSVNLIRSVVNTLDCSAVQVLLRVWPLDGLLASPYK